jgi:hypothetical protein
MIPNLDRNVQRRLRYRRLHPRCTQVQNVSDIRSDCHEILHLSHRDGLAYKEPFGVNTARGFPAMTDYAKMHLTQEQRRALATNPTRDMPGVTVMDMIEALERRVAALEAKVLHPEPTDKSPPKPDQTVHLKTSGGNVVSSGGSVSSGGTSAALSGTFTVSSGGGVSSGGTAGSGFVSGGR